MLQLGVPAKVKAITIFINRIGPLFYQISALRLARRLVAKMRHPNFDRYVVGTYDMV